MNLTSQNSSILSDGATVGVHVSEREHSSCTPLPQLGSVRPPPSVLDHQVLRLIGAGSYGEVWLARNVLGQLRAVKVITGDRFREGRPLGREFEGIQRFEPISRSHPSQLAILHVGKNDEAGIFYYVMELADDAGPKCGAPNSESNGAEFQCYTPHTLRFDLEQRQRLPVDDCVRIGLSLTTALEHLHSHGLVHRDIKPSNIVFVNGIPKLGDIGLVTDAGDTRSIVGTEGYIAPEGPGTLQGDIFSLGKVLYESSTGMDRRCFPELPKDLRNWPDQSALVEFNEIVLKACAKDPARRYPSAEQMRRDLEWLEAGKSLRLKRTWENCWRRSKHILLAAGLVLSIGTIGIYSSREPPNRFRPISSDPEAVRLYHQAVYQLHELTPASYRPALANLKEAIKRDPAFVRAYFALFEAYKNAIVIWVDMDWQREYQSHIRDIAKTLRAKAPKSPESCVVQSYVAWMDWQFERALLEVERAINLNPRFVRAHQLKAYYTLLSRGDIATARREYELAARYDDQADAVTQTELGHPDFFCRNYTSAFAKYSEAIRLERDNATAYKWRGTALDGMGRYAEAVDQFEEWALRSTGNNPQIVAEFAEIKQSLGAGGVRGWIQNDLERRLEKNPGDHYWLASNYARLGQTQEAIPLLRKALDEHDPRMVNLLFEAQWDGYRNEPWFKQLVLRVGLKEPPWPRK